MVEKKLIEKISDEDLENVSGGGIVKKIVDRALIGMGLYVGFKVMKNCGEIKRNNGGQFPLGEGAKLAKDAFNKGVDLLNQVAGFITTKITGQSLSES